MPARQSDDQPTLMFAFLERFITHASPAWRVLIALWASTPFYLLVIFMYGLGLWDPDVRKSLDVNVVLFCILVFSLATLTNLAVHWQLWPMRQSPEPVPKATLLTIQSIGITFSTMAVSLGFVTCGAFVVLVGVLAVGIWLFDRRPMVLGHHLVNFIFVSYDIGVLLGWWSYAPALSPQMYADPKAMWWLHLVQQQIFLCGWATMLSLLWAIIGTLESTTAQLAHLSNADGLTGLANRRRFMEVLSAEIDRQAGTQQPMCVVLIDADHFKRVNDEHGHAEGDKVLVALAQVLSSGLRRPTDLACRLGGEEFALILPDTSTRQAIDVCQRMRQMLSGQMFGAEGRRFRLTVSMGLVESTGKALEDVFKRADEQLYRAKSSGRDRVCMLAVQEQP
jgi:diguanylate cyclase (GGDEF)-like protein